MADERDSIGPREQGLTSALIEQLEEGGFEAFAAAGVQRALAGDFRFWAYIFERVEGRLPDAVEVGDDWDGSEPGDP